VYLTSFYRKKGGEGEGERESAKTAELISVWYDGGTEKISTHRSPDQDTFSLMNGEGRGKTSGMGYRGRNPLASDLKTCFSEWTIPGSRSVRTEGSKAGVKLPWFIQTAGVAGRWQKDCHLSRIGRKEAPFWSYDSGRATSEFGEDRSLRNVPKNRVQKNPNTIAAKGERTKGHHCSSDLVCGEEEGGTG